jgi:hypothetical protein
MSHMYIYLLFVSSILDVIVSTDLVKESTLERKWQHVIVI